MIERGLRFRYNEIRNEVIEVIKDSKPQMIKQEFPVKYTLKDSILQTCSKIKNICSSFIRRCTRKIQKQRRQT